MAEAAARVPSHRLRVSVVTPEGAAYQGEASAVVVPGLDGETAFLPGHAAYLGALGLGALRVTAPDGSVRRWFLEGGVAQVADDQVTILSEKVARPEDLDAAADRKAIAEALASAPASEAEFAARDHALGVARAHLRLLSRPPAG